MSFSAARTELVAVAEAAKAAWVGPPSPLLLSYQNQGLIDPGSQFDPYLCVDIFHLNGEQLSMGQTKALVDYGQIHLVAHARENGGMLVCQQILDHFRPYFELKTFATVRTHASRGAAEYAKAGWVCYPLVVPFWVNRLVT